MKLAGALLSLVLFAGAAEAQQLPDMAPQQRTEAERAEVVLRCGKNASDMHNLSMKLRESFARSHDIGIPPAYLRKVHRNSKSLADALMEACPRLRDAKQRAICEGNQAVAQAATDNFQALCHYFDITCPK